MANQIICEWSARSWYRWFGQRVIVDLSAESVTFEHCHMPRRFWTLWWQKRYTCSLTEIRAVYRDNWLTRHIRHRMSWSNATIVTRTGKAVINDWMVGFEEVVAALSRFAQPGERRLVDDPNFWSFCTMLFIVFIIPMCAALWLYFLLWR